MTTIEFPDDAQNVALVAVTPVASADDRSRSRLVHTELLGQQPPCQHPRLLSTVQGFAEETSLTPQIRSSTVLYNNTAI